MFWLLLTLISKFCSNEEGVRNLKRCLETIISKVNIYYLSYKTSPRKDSISEKVEEVIDRILDEVIDSNVDSNVEEKDIQDKKESSESVPLTFEIKDFKLPLTITNEIVNILLKETNDKNVSAGYMYM